MGSSCSCCGEDTSEKGLPLLAAEITKIADLPLNKRRKHIIKALYAVLEVGLHEVTSLFAIDDSPSDLDGALGGGVSDTVVDELLSALDRTLQNLDPTLTRNQRYEVINRSTPLSQDRTRHRLMVWATERRTSSVPAQLATAKSNVRLKRSQSMAPRGGAEMSSSSRCELPRILEFWFNADTDCSGSLEPSEVRELLHLLNIDLPPTRVAELIKEVDFSKNGVLEFGEFVVLYQKLTSLKAVEDISRRLGMCLPLTPSVARESSSASSSKKKSNKTKTTGSVGSAPMKRLAGGQAVSSEVLVIPEASMRSFLLQDQREPSETIGRSLKQVGKMRTYGGDAAPSVLGITAREFHVYLLDAAVNSWMHPRENRVHMDMTQPYTHYFIDSSHNTYLAGHQLTGQSSCDMYKKAVLSGCRCVEIDCWDGPNGDPMVTHGYTLTSTLRFFDVIATLKEFGFQSSPYPLMLSLELHTSPPQQETMVKMMRDAWGSDLLTAADAEASRLSGPEFSMEGLKHKVLVKGKRSGTADSGGSAVALEEVNLLVEGSDPGSPLGPAVAKKDETAQAAKKHAGHTAVCAALNAITYISAVPFTTAEAMMAKPHYVVSSVDENRIDRWMKEGPQPYIDVSKQMLLRVYPKGMRTDSSNFNPQNSWNCGAQLVALNIQTNDEGNRINRFKFRCNGQCGVILKPLSMRAPLGTPVTTGFSDWVVTVKVLCGVQIPKPRKSTRGEIIDPFVVLFICGFGSDDTSAARKSTKVVPNNGFNPHWEEEFVFKIRFPEMAMLCVQVHEADPLTSELIADNGIPLTALREGYRCVPLYVDGEQLPSPTCVFCYFHIQRPLPSTDVGHVAPAPMIQGDAHSPTSSPLSLRRASLGGKTATAALELDTFVAERLDML